MDDLHFDISVAVSWMLLAYTVGWQAQKPETGWIDQDERGVSMMFKPFLLHANAPFPVKCFRLLGAVAFMMAGHSDSS